MSQTLTVRLEGPIASVNILDNRPGGMPEGSDLAQNSESGQAGFSQTCRVLKAVIDKLNRFYDRVFSEHREQIAKLSVEIARKILAQKVQDGDYEIESIVQEALKNVPSRDGITVRLNPEDLAQLEKLRQDNGGDFSGVKFVADANVGRAGCVLETGRGIIESVIDKHLEQINGALKKAK